MSENCLVENVENFSKDEGSLYWLYRRLINIRRKHRALAEGSYRSVIAEGDLLLYCREHGEDRLLVALNMGSAALALSLPDQRLSGRVLLSSFTDREMEEVTERVSLRANEGLLVKLDRPGDALK